MKLINAGLLACALLASPAGRVRPVGGTPVTFGILGPLRVQAGDTPVLITAPKQRTLPAMLLARAGHVVPVRTLVAEVWDDQPPRSAVANLRTYLMRLRKLIPPSPDPAVERLVTSDTGYLLWWNPDRYLSVVEEPTEQPLGAQK